MSTPKQPRQRPATPRAYPKTVEGLIDPAFRLWEPLEAVPGYLRSTDGRIAREIKVRTNKNGTRFARVSIKGRQHVVRV